MAPLSQTRPLAPCLNAILALDTFFSKTSLLQGSFNSGCSATAHFDAFQKIMLNHDP